MSQKWLQYIGRKLFILQSRPEVSSKAHQHQALIFIYLIVLNIAQTSITFLAIWSLLTLHTPHNCTQHLLTIDKIKLLDYKACKPLLSFRALWPRHSTPYCQVTSSRHVSSLCDPPILLKFPCPPPLNKIKRGKFGYRERHTQREDYVKIAM